MKLNEKHGQMERESNTRMLLKSFQENINHLLYNKAQAVSFQLAYDNVFKLTKLGHQNEILSILDENLGSFLKEKLRKEIKLSVQNLKELLIDVKEVSQRMTEICLFLDINYCQKILHVPIAKRLNARIFKDFISETNVLQIIAKAVFQARSKNGSKFEEVLALIDQVDEKEQFFEKYLIPHYLPLISEYYSKAAAETWNIKGLSDYVEWCRLKLQEEQRFVQKNLANKKKKKQGVEAVIACIYQAIVGGYKQKIYENDEKQLFEGVTILTLPILELFKFGKGKDVEGHIQWFMAALEKKLNAIPVNGNNEFIQLFCELYNKVSLMLKDTQSKFQINYRSIFTFQEWINNQRFNIPLRLNIYLDERFRKNENTKSQEFLKKVIMIFKLIKEKNLFENLYRKMLLNRLVRFYATYNLKDEETLIEAMQQECGEEWSEKIKAICSVFKKDRAELLRKKGLTQIKENQDIRIGGLIPLIVVESAWPFQSKNSKIKLHSELMKMTPNFQKQYLPEATKNRLCWSSNVGTVTMEIKFKGIKREFLVSVDMANLLLYLQKGSKKLSHFVCENGYTIDEVESFVQELINQKIIESKQRGNDYQLRLVDSFEEGPLMDLSGQQYNNRLQVKAMQELKADRKLMVEAIIVKIMKGQKVCKRQELVDKSAPLVVQKGFKFNADFVENSIDRLIEKEFIRAFEDGNLGYIA